RERTNSDQHVDGQQAKHKNKSELLLRPTRRQAREDKKIVLWDCHGCPLHKILIAAAAARGTKVMALEYDKAILPELIVILPPGLPSN
ncbi:hypothetical protein, partial [Mesorhizobium sp.]|uniref:hypothetical protein n=1 Tax=Mesorhizobium sp. TaxID=1871066 RepID=UPI0025E395EE